MGDVPNNKKVISLETSIGDLYKEYGRGPFKEKELLLPRLKDCECAPYIDKIIEKEGMNGMQATEIKPDGTKRELVSASELYPPSTPLGYILGGHCCRSATR